MMTLFRQDNAARALRPEPATRQVRPALARPAPTHRRSFLVVEPQALVRHGLSLALSSLHAGAATLQAASPTEAVEMLARGGEADVALLDLDGLGPDRVAAVGDFVQAVGVPVVLMSTAVTTAEVRGCLLAGARACVLKSDPTEVLEHAVALALLGEAYIQLPRQVLAEAPHTTPSAEDESSVERLTARQRQIFRLLLSGCSNKEIARQLGVLEGTVKVHVRAMMQKLGARNRTQMAVLAARTGFRQSA